MKDFSVDRKLQLVQQVRSRYRRDQSDLSEREQILYGRSSAPRYYEEEEYFQNGEEVSSGEGTLGLRLLLAALAAAALVALDRNGDTLFGMEPRQIMSYLSTDTLP